MGQHQVADQEQASRRQNHGQVEAGRGREVPQGLGDAAFASPSHDPAHADVAEQEQARADGAQQARDRRPGVQTVQSVQGDADHRPRRQGEGDGEIHHGCADRPLRRRQGVGRQDRQHGRRNAQGGQLQIGQIGRQLPTDPLGPELQDQQEDQGAEQARRQDRPGEPGCDALELHLTLAMGLGHVFQAGERHPQRAQLQHGHDQLIDGGGDAEAGRRQHYGQDLGPPQRHQGHQDLQGRDPHQRTAPDSSASLVRRCRHRRDAPQWVRRFSRRTFTERPKFDDCN